MRQYSSLSLAPWGVLPPQVLIFQCPNASVFTRLVLSGIDKTFGISTKIVKGVPVVQVTVLAQPC